MAKSKTTNKKANKSKFARNFKRYVIILCILSVMFLIHVMNTLYQYEESYPENYMYNIFKIAIK